MNVRELIEQLSLLDPELEVYTSRDDEGNGYNGTHYAPTVFLAANADKGPRAIEVFNEDDIDDCGYDESELTKIVVI